MKCEYCDNEVPTGVTRCPSCGAVVRSQAPQPSSMTQFSSTNSVANLVQDSSQSQPQSNERVTVRRSRAIYFVLGFFFGVFGIHNWYVGHKKYALAHLILALLSMVTYGLTGVASWIWAIVEIIIVTKDADGNFLT